MSAPQHSPTPTPPYSCGRFRGYQNQNIYDDRCSLHQLHEIVVKQLELILRLNRGSGVYQARYHGELSKLKKRLSGWSKEVEGFRGMEGRLRDILG